MTSTTLGVLGAGPHGHEIAAGLRRRGFAVELFDDGREQFLPTSHCDVPYVIGAAWPKVRQQIAHKTTGEAWQDGVVIFHGAEVGYDTRIGAHTHVGMNATVAHGCILGRFVQVCPGAQLAGDVWVGDGAFIGIGAVVMHGGIRIGAGATVGAGAVVTRHVRDGETVIGNPAREYRP